MGDDSHSCGQNGYGSPLFDDPGRDAAFLKKEKNWIFRFIEMSESEREKRRGESESDTFSAEIIGAEVNTNDTSIQFSHIFVFPSS